MFLKYIIFNKLIKNNMFFKKSLPKRIFKNTYIYFKPNVYLFHQLNIRNIKYNNFKKNNFNNIYFFIRILKYLKLSDRKIKILKSLLTNKIIGNLLTLNNIKNIIITVIYYNSWSYLKYLIRILMWQIKVNKHKSIFFFLKSLFKILYFKYKNLISIKSIGYKLKGKLAVTGNKRKRTLLNYYGYNTFFRIDNNIFYEHFLIRTSTGILSIYFYISFKNNH